MNREGLANGNEYCPASIDDLRITADGNLARVNKCPLHRRQRRSGSAFEISAFFDEIQMNATERDPKTHNRTGESGNPIYLHFCPTCSIAVYCQLSAHPLFVGIHRA